MGGCGLSRAAPATMRPSACRTSTTTSSDRAPNIGAIETGTTQPKPELWPVFEPQVPIVGIEPQAEPAAAPVA